MTYNESSDELSTKVQIKYNSQPFRNFFEM